MIIVSMFVMLIWFPLTGGYRWGYERYLSVAVGNGYMILHGVFEEFSQLVSFLLLPHSHV